jgi:hypothetical protein
MLRRKKRPWHAPDRPAACDEMIDGLFAVTCGVTPDLSDMNRFHRVIACNVLVAMLMQLALLDPELSQTRH